MIKQDNYVFIILDKIAKYKGWGLLMEPGLNKTLSSQFLHQMEKNGYIKINGKNITEENIIEYHNLEFTDDGMKLYQKFKDS